MGGGGWRINGGSGFLAQLEGKQGRGSPAEAEVRLRQLEAELDAVAPSGTDRAAGEAGRSEPSAAATRMLGLVQAVMGGPAPPEGGGG